MRCAEQAAVSYPTPLQRTVVFFKQKTAYEIRPRDWSSDVCSSDLLGLEYLGIADHSKSSIQAHGIDETKLRAQIATIRKLNKNLDDLRLFAGVECDILRDGTLDFSDETLSRLDFVVASVHSVFNLNEAEMTRGFVRAMQNRYVTILAHPTGRLLLSREPYHINCPGILRELPSSPTRLSLN